MNWPLVELGIVCERVSVGHVGKTSEFYTDESGIPFLRTQNVSKEGLDLDDVMYVTKDFHEKLKKSQLQSGDIILSRVISNRINCAVIPENFGQANCANIILARPNPEKLDAKFFLHYLKSDVAQRVLLGRQVGSAQSVVNTSVLKSWIIPLPPLSEQKRIAAILDKADQLRQKRQQAINLADEFLRSVFLEMFGDPVTNPKGWEEMTFADVGTLDRGKSKHRPRNDPALLDGNHPLIQTGDVANCDGYIRSFVSTYSDLGLKQSRKWPEGTLCITIAANIAKTGILTFQSCFPDSVVGFTPSEKVTVEYIQHWLRFLQKTLEASAPESAQKNINLKILRELKLPVPDIVQQEKFSAIVKSKVNIRERKKIQQECVDILFMSLSQKAFAGQL